MTKIDLFLLFCAVALIIIILSLISVLQNPVLFNWLVGINFISNTPAALKNIIFIILMLAIITTIIIFALFIKLLYKLLK